MFKKFWLVLVGVVFFLAVTKLSYAMMCGGHTKNPQIAETDTAEHTHAGHKADTESTTESTLEESVNVGNKICPVSGEKIDDKMKTTYEYEGKIYNFCCAMCIEEFKKDPEKYIEKIEEELEVESEEDSKEDIEEETMHRGHHH